MVLLFLMSQVFMDYAKMLVFVQMHQQVKLLMMMHLIQSFHLRSMMNMHMH